MIADVAVRAVGDGSADGATEGFAAAIGTPQPLDLPFPADAGAVAVAVVDEVVAGVAADALDGTPQPLAFLTGGVAVVTATVCATESVTGLPMVSSSTEGVSDCGRRPGGGGGRDGTTADVIAVGPCRCLSKAAHSNRCTMTSA